MGNVYHPNADWSLATQVVGDNGRVAFIPSFQQVDSAGAPVSVNGVGATNFSTGQAATSISPAAATQLVAARANRRSVTITNITGTQPVYVLTSNAITGATTGAFIPGTAGASLTLPTTAAIFGTSPTAAQTVSVLETY